ncbi:hypothetical protein Tco_1140424 [Tanacetum coccineum]
MSPYLFTLVMEVFNLILHHKIMRNARFKYHHGSKELDITHLCFTDDLLVLCHGDVDSVRVIKKALEKFSVVSGLNESCLLDIWGFPLYKKIGMKDCKCLIDQVKSRIQDWKNNCLSYGGRTQLIDSVLSSIQVYWASVFKLPKMVINDIEKLFKGFLWNNGELQRGKTKVAWKELLKRTLSRSNESVQSSLKKGVFGSVKCILPSLKVKNSKAVKAVEEVWKINMCKTQIMQLLGIMLIIAMDGLAPWKYYGTLLLLDSYGL